MGLADFLFPLWMQSLFIQIWGVCIVWNTCIGHTWIPINKPALFDTNFLLSCMVALAPAPNSLYHGPLKPMVSMFLGVLVNFKAPMSILICYICELVCICSFSCPGLWSKLPLLFIYLFSWRKFKEFLLFYICSDRTCGASIFRTVYTSHYLLFLLDIMFSFADLFLDQVKQMKFLFWKLLRWLWEGISFIFPPSYCFSSVCSWMMELIHMLMHNAETLNWFS